MARELARGDEVVVARSLCPEARGSRNDGRGYFYESTGNTTDIPLQTKGNVASIQGKRVVVALEGGKRAAFHIKELRLSAKKERENASIFSQMPVFALQGVAAQTTVFIIDERAYWLSSEQEARETGVGFFYQQKRGKEERTPLVGGTRLRQLERMLLHQQTGKIRGLEKKFLKSFEEAQENKAENEPTALRFVRFALDEVFPYFAASPPTEQIAAALGDETVLESELPKKPSTPATNKRVEQLLDRIRAEEFEERVFTEEESFIDYPRAYKPTSVVGSALQGRNAALIQGEAYALQRSFEGIREYRIELKGQHFSLFPAGDSLEIWERAAFIIDKTLRLRALERAAKEGWGLENKDERIAKLAAKGEHREGEVGFVLRSRFSPDRDDASSGKSCFIWVTIPEHAMRQPGSETYYRFSETRATVPIYVNDNSVITWDTPRIIGSRYAHPFVFEDGRICLGGFNYDRLRRFGAGEAVAQLLATTRRTLLSGYTSSGVNPARNFGDLYSHRISLERLRELKIPITNDFLKGAGKGGEAWG